MINMPEGTRVYAIRDSDAETVYAFGFGTYVGDYPYPEGGPGILGGNGYLMAERAMAERVIREDDERDEPQAAPLIRQAFEEGAITAEQRDTQLAVAVEKRAEEQALPMEVRVANLIDFSRRNPKIVLDDNAGVVWGCECWWGPADPENMEQLTGGRDIVLVAAPHPPEEAIDE